MLKIEQNAVINFVAPQFEDMLKMYKFMNSLVELVYEQELLKIYRGLDRTERNKYNHVWSDDRVVIENALEVFEVLKSMGFIATKELVIPTIDNLTLAENKE